MLAGVELDAPDTSSDALIAAMTYISSNSAASKTPGSTLGKGGLTSPRVALVDPATFFPFCTLLASCAGRALVASAKVVIGQAVAVLGAPPLPLLWSFGLGSSSSLPYCLG